MDDTRRYYKVGFVSILAVRGGYIVETAGGKHTVASKPALLVLLDKMLMDPLEEKEWK